MSGRSSSELAAGESIVDAAGNESLRRKLYRLKDADQDFAAEWKRAYQEGTDALTPRHDAGAVEGVDEPRMIGHGDNAELIMSSGTAIRCSCS
jgi:hypothetical protein